MKTRIFKQVLLLGATVLLSTGTFAQDKYKTNKNETKYKTSGYKVKENKNETKIKGTLVRPKVFDKSTVVTEERKTGQTQVRTKETLIPLDSRTVADEKPVVATAEPIDMKTIKKSTTVAKKKSYAKARKAPARKVAARKTPARKLYAAAKPQIIRDTVYIEKEPETRVVTNTEFVRDTVVVSRVDTVFRTQSFTGYRMPSVNYKKLKLKKDGNEIYMKKKTEDGKWIKEKFEDENEYNSYRKDAER
jgi:hypothetical protein